MNPTTTAEKIIQSVCELQEMPALDHPETILISVTDLRTIVENHVEASCIWLPIAEADKTIVHEQYFPSVNMTLRNSERYWVRDTDGRVYEASWSEGNDGRDFWWDWEGESPVNPVQFMPHPLAALSAPASQP